MQMSKAVTPPRPGSGSEADPAGSGGSVGRAEEAGGAGGPGGADPASAQVSHRIDPGLRSTLLRAVTARREELIQLLVASVQRESVSGCEDAAVDFYAQWATARGWSVMRQALSGSTVASQALRAQEPRLHDRTNLLLAPAGALSAAPILINGHVDVVPAGELERWGQTAPFAGTRRRGRVHGRGSVDTKGGIAAALIAYDVLRELGLASEQLAMLLVVGEETSGIGTRAAFDLVPHPAAAIVLEPTAGSVVAASSGLVFFTIETYGLSAHTSAPWRGQDALQALLQVHEDLQQMAQRRAGSFSHPLLDELPQPAPYVVGTLNAGTFRAAVPDYAVMSGRLGVLPGESPHHVAEQLRDIVAQRTRGASRPASVRIDGVPLAGWSTSLEAPVVQAMSAAQGDVAGSVRLRGLSAGSDAAFYGERDIPTILYGPGDMELAHGPEESIGEDDVVQAAMVLALAAWQLTRDPRVERSAP